MRNAEGLLVLPTTCLAVASPSDAASENHMFLMFCRRRPPQGPLSAFDPPRRAKPLPPVAQAFLDQHPTFSPDGWDGSRELHPPDRPPSGACAELRGGSLQKVEEGSARSSAPESGGGRRDGLTQLGCGRESVPPALADATEPESLVPTLVQVRAL